MKRILMSLIFISISILSFANSHNRSGTKLRLYPTGVDSAKKGNEKRVCEASQSGSIGTYLTKITITCTSTAPTCEQAEKSAKDCAEKLIMDAYTKVKVAMS